MSRENVEMLRRAYEAFARGDLDAMVADAAPDLLYVGTDLIPGVTGEFRGGEEYKRAIAWIAEEFDDWGAEINEFIDAGDQVVGSLTLSGRGKQSGAKGRWNIWQVWTVSEGKFVDGRGFANREDALEAAGLPPSLPQSPL